MVLQKLRHVLLIVQFLIKIGNKVLNYTSNRLGSCVQEASALYERKHALTFTVL